MPAHGAVRMPAVRRGMLEGTARRGCGARDSRGGNALRSRRGAVELHGLLHGGRLLHAQRRGGGGAVLQAVLLRRSIVLQELLRSAMLHALLRGRSVMTAVVMLRGRLQMRLLQGVMPHGLLRGLVLLALLRSGGMVVAVVVVQGRHAVRLLHLMVLRGLVLFTLRGMADGSGLGRTVQHLVRVLVDGCIQTAVGAHGGRVTVGVMRRGTHAVAAVRVMPMAVVPGGGGPEGHQAGRRQRGKREDGNTVRRITVHGAAVAVAVDGEAVGIVAGGRPRSGNTHAHAAVRIAHGGAAIHRVMVNTGA